MLKHWARQFLSEQSVKRVRGALVRRNQKRLRKIAFTEADLLYVLTEICRVARGDLLFISGSIDGLGTNIPARRILDLVFDLVGPDGTVLMPSYPKLTSHLFLKSGQVWDVRRTPSHMGLLSEVLRRMDGTKRSLHPTKSVAARGPLRDELVSNHHESIWPYSELSPYRRFVELHGKAIGLGVSARYTAFIHTIEDYLGDAFPIKVYHPEVFVGRVRDYRGREIEVRTLAHNLSKIAHWNTPRYFRTFFGNGEAASLRYKGRDFFYADAHTVFYRGVKLARRGLTIYSRRFAMRRASVGTPAAPSQNMM
jgi:aminoglycoside 3-N-acetyltransferase